MKCPFCRQKLFLGKLRKFETIIEHGFNPNATDYPLRATYECKCEASWGGFWGKDGSFYCNSEFDRDYAKRFSNSPFSALSSWQKKYDNSCKFERFLKDKLGFSYKTSVHISHLFFYL